MSKPSIPTGPALGRRTLLSGSLAALAVGSLVRPDVAIATAPGRPGTVPALREWVPASGSFGLAPTVRVVVSPADLTALGSAADLLAADLAVLTGNAVPVVAAAVGPGDIGLR